MLGRWSDLAPGVPRLLQVPLDAGVGWGEVSGDRLAEVDCPTCDGKGWWHDHCDRCYATGEWCGCGGEQRRCETCAGSGRVEVVTVSLARLDSGATEEDA